MALMVHCEKHNVGYVVGDIYPEWWRNTGIPACPYCRMEWGEAHRDDWEFPVPYEIFVMGTRLAMEDCVAHVSIQAASDEGMTGPCVSDPLLVALAASTCDPWWLPAKRFIKEVFWRIRLALQVLLYGYIDY